MKHHRTCGNLNIITNTDTTIDDGTGVDTHIVTNCGTTAFAITQRDHLQAIEITTYAFGIQVRRVVVFKMSTRTNTRTPNGQCTLWRKQPLDRSSKILPYSIIEQITERTFTGTSLDEVQHMRKVDAESNMVCVNGFIRSDFWVSFVTDIPRYND